ncbi:MAG: YceI family protein [Xanthomonadales bacterium]|nr:YceI family protein [Xanthomonadales bacterium]
MAALFAASAASADTWRSLADQSTLEFIPSYEDTPLPSRFGRFEVRLDFDPDRPAEGRLAVTVWVASADMQDAQLNAEIQAPGWFGVSLHPEARFESTDITRRGDEFVAAGTLSLKGVRREVRVPFRWQADQDGARMQGALELDRSDFGIGDGEWAADQPIAHAVGVRFDIQLEASD